MGREVSNLNMEEISLKDYLAEHPEPSGDEVEKNAKQLWYNRYGDCIEYQTQQVAIVADRIDSRLTIYRSAETDKPIGFQLKDVTALMKKYQADLGVLWSTQAKNLISVTALFLVALEEDRPWSIKKRLGYQEALRNLAKDDEVPV